MALLHLRSQAVRQASGFAFYNTSRYDFEKLLANAPHLAANLRNYIAGFSPNMREVLEEFDFDNTITRLNDADGVPFRFMRASHLAVIALSVGRAKDFSRILALLEAGSIHPEQVALLAQRHGLSDAWKRFKTRFLDE